MKTYEQPEIEVIKYEAHDFIAISADSEHDNIFGDIMDFFKLR